MQHRSFMNRLAVWALLAAAFLLHGGAHAQVQPATQAPTDALEAIGARIGAHQVIRARFTQTRQIAALTKPLVSSGQLIYSQRHGVVWRIEHPYRMSYLLSDKKVVEISGDGTRKERDVPGLAQVNRVFSAVLGTDTGALREYFDVTATSDAARWKLTLKPRNQLAQFMSGMQVGGSTFVESIRIDDAGGDSTTLVFRATEGAGTLDAAELQAFGLPAATR